MRNIFKTLIHQKAYLLLVLLAGITAGEVIQLNWIHDYCANQPFFRGTGHCGDNLLRIGLGGILGVVVLLPLCAISIRVLYAGNKEAGLEKIARVVMPAFGALLLTLLIPLSQYKNRKIIILLTGLVFFVILTFRGFPLLKNSLIAAKDWLFKGYSLAYKFRTDNGSIVIQFKGAYAQAEAQGLSTMLAEDLLQLEGRITKISVDFSQAQATAAQLKIVVLQALATALVLDAQFEIRAAQDFHAGIIGEINNLSSRIRLV